MPTRVIEGQATKISRAMHDISYDDVHDEIMIANPMAQAILTFRGGADGEEPPLRVLQGPLTQIVNPDYGVVVDPVHNELFVAEQEYVLVFPRTATGNVAPIRVIRGPNTRISGAKALAVDPINNVLVASSEESMDGGKTFRGWILIFDRTANGNVAPRGVIEGPKTLINDRISHLRITPKGWIVAPLRAPRGKEGGLGTIPVWSVHDNGDIPPRWILGGPKSQIRRSGPIRMTLIPKNKEVLIGGGGTIWAYSFPEIF